MVFGGKGGYRPQPDLRPPFVGNGRPQGQTATQPELQSEPTQAQVRARSNAGSAVWWATDTPEPSSVAAAEESPLLKTHQALRLGAR